MGRRMCGVFVEDAEMLCVYDDDDVCVIKECAFMMLMLMLMCDEREIVCVMMMCVHTLLRSPRRARADWK